MTQQQQERQNLIENLKNFRLSNDSAEGLADAIISDFKPSENVGQLACGNYEQDDTTAMNCKHCGRSKWLHSANVLYPPSNTSGQLAEIANQYALSVMPTHSLQELSIISDAVIYGHGLRSVNIGQLSEYATQFKASVSSEGVDNIASDFLSGLQKGRELESEKAIRFAEWLSITGWLYLQEYEAWSQGKKHLEYFTTYELYNSQEFEGYLKQFEIGF
jgi:hypothetical protein